MATLRSASARLLRSSRSFLPKVTSRSLVQCSFSPLRTQKIPSTIYSIQRRYFADENSSSAPASGLFALEPTAKLYVGNLFFEVTATQLEDLFRPFGNVVSAKIISDFKGFSKGYGFIEFGTKEDATKAKESMDQTIYAGRSLVVNYVRPLFAAKPPERPTEPTSTLFVGNLAYNLTDKELNNLFRPLANIRDVRVAIDRRTGQPRGFAHADFLDVKSAIAAQKYLNGLEVSGRVLRADYSVSGRNQAMMQYQSKGTDDAAAPVSTEPAENIEAVKEQGEIAEAETDSDKRI